MNNKLVTSIGNLQETLQQFYSTVVTFHQQSEQKIQVLELFLAKINEYEINKKSKQNKDHWNVQTQASLQDAQESVLNQEKKLSMSPNMLYTFLFSHNQNRDLVESEHLTKVKPKTQFESKQLKRVLLYAVLVYCIHSRKSDQASMMRHDNTNHLLRTIKKAQVKSAYLLRASLGRKLYTKTRFLCEKLHQSIEDANLSTEQIIKIIVEEFHPFFVDQIFTQLSHQSYSQSCLQSLNSLDFTLQFNQRSLEKRNEPSYQQLRAFLQNLDIILSIRNEQKTQEIGKRSKINIVVELNRKGEYFLTQIALFREWKEVSSVPN